MPHGRVAYMKSRLTTGGALVVVLISALVLVILGVGFITFSKIFGGGREMQNAVDSGSLNAAKTALLRPGTDSSNSDEAQFLGFKNPDGSPNFSLGNINRVWGQALLVSLNQKAMEAEGSADSTLANDHANKTVAAAKAINDRIAAALRPVSNLPPNDLKVAFLNTSNSNTLKMVSSNANDQLEISDGAQVGFQNAKGPANIHIDLSDTSKLLTNIVDSNDAAAKLALKTTTDIISAGTTPFSGQGSANVVKGYTDIKVDDNKQIYFVPLRPEAKPHMLSGTEFSAQAPTLTATANPVNNSFFTKGKMKEENSKNMLDFASIALAEPVDKAYALSIPRGYIKVKNWKGFGVRTTILEANTNNTQAVDDSQRGLNAAEYANHQLLMARSGYAGPGHPDQFTDQMGNPYYGLIDQQGNPLLNANGDPVFGQQSDVQKLIDRNEAQAPAPGDPPLPPVPTDSTCGGALATDLPNGVTCADIKTGNTAAAEASVSVDGNGNVVATNPGQSSAMSVAIVNFLIEHVHQSEEAFGSDIHPHIWSIDPKRVNAVNNPSDFMKTGPNAAEAFNWMYTGVLVMPNNPETGHFSRNGNGTQSPIQFGYAGTVWDYLENADPGQNGASPEQTQILGRMTQRILEIKPDFDVSKLEEVLSKATVDLHQDAYIFMDDNKNMTMAVVKGDSFDHVGGDQMPQWLKDEVSALNNKVDGKADEINNGLLGKTVFYGKARRITTQPTDGQGNYVENVPGDWGYTEPYTNADNPPPGAQMVNIYMSNKYVFRPCTGYQGQLALLELKAFIHHEGCPVDYAAGVTPEKCPCVTFPEGSQPAPTGTNTVNTPNGWNQGTNTTDTGLPNCSHTGAC